MLMYSTAGIAGFMTDLTAELAKHEPISKRFSKEIEQDSEIYPENIVSERTFGNHDDGVEAGVELGYSYLSDEIRGLMAKHGLA